tara:strand:- start:207 stop:347 length:141 start_codon:yes stop_codon:yes gene_type:complete
MSKAAHAPPLHHRFMGIMGELIGEVQHFICSEQHRYNAFNMCPQKG